MTSLSGATAIKTKRQNSRSAANGILAIRVCTLIVILAIWEAVSRSGWFYKGVIPPLEDIGTALWSLLLSASLYKNLWVTLAEIAGGIVISSLAGVGLGILLGVKVFAGKVAEPYLVALASTPKIVFLPIVMLALGVGPESKVALGALSAFFPIVLSTLAGVASVSRTHLNVARSYNCSNWQQLRLVYLPSLTQPILTGMRLGLGVCVIGVLLGEIKLSNAGLGFLANDFYNLYRIPELYALLIVVFLLAAGANMGMTALSRRVRKDQGA